MLDVDGTIVGNNNFEALPSPRVREAIKKAKEILHVGIVTSRPLFLTKKIFTALELSGPCIVQGGAQIVDGETHEIISQHFLPREILMKAYEVAKKHNIEIHADYDVEHIEITDDFPVDKNFFGVVTFPAIERTKAKLFFHDLRRIPELAVFTSESHEDISKEFVFGTHAGATKQHGILEAAEILGIDTHEIIGVGDGYKDFPMMMACGLKVAMGNAVSDLKEIADFIAPTVDEDGVAEVIERFILD